jgi:signal transduction histidine kinase
LRNANVLILTDEAEFGRLLSACWQAEQQAPRVTIVDNAHWEGHVASSPDLVVAGPMREGSCSKILRSFEPTTAVILCAPVDAKELGTLRGKHPRLVHVPLREDWTQTLLLVAGESLRRTAAVRLAREAERHAQRNERDAMLGRYMMDMKHSVNNALTSMLGNAELLLLEPGQLSSQSLAQIKTIHNMALRINEIMQRFSSLSSEMRDVETGTSQAENQGEPAATGTRR